jgi:ABC-type antimicrobial peptide transport system permease subunit
MGDSIKLAVRELRRRWLRTMLNILGYALIACFIVVMVLMLQYDLQAKDSIVRPMGGKFLVYAPIQADLEKMETKQPINPDSEGFFTEPMVKTKLLPVSIAERLAKIPEISAVTPFMLFRMKQGDDGHIFSLGGIKIEDKYALASTMVSERDIIAGTYFSPTDKNVVVIDKSYAELWNLKPGSVVNIANALYPVIGVVSSHARTARADIYMNWRDAKTAINKRLTEPLADEANLFLVASAGGEFNAAAIEKAKKVVDSELWAYAVNCSLHVADFMGISKETLKYLLVGICLFAFLFSATSQWLLVNERRHEVAILRSLGWQKKNVLSQFLYEAILQGTLGIGFGLIIGVVIFPFLGEMVGVKANINYVVLDIYGVFIKIFLGILLIICIFAIMASLRVTNELPSKILRR